MLVGIDDSNTLWFCNDVLASSALQVSASVMCEITVRRQVRLVSYGAGRVDELSARGVYLREDASLVNALALASPPPATATAAAAVDAHLLATIGHRGGMFGAQPAAGTDDAEATTSTTTTATPSTPNLLANAVQVCTL
jgi:hypothetical protein